MHGLDTWTQRIGFAIVWLLVVGSAVPQLGGPVALASAAVVGGVVSYIIVRGASAFRSGMRGEQAA